ncbi:hypothetical protein SMACR_06311 [Sordaria macrospora]|uniref:WGS project CABT00000000 data, contig 2.34 n=2 Tax=Sordaria macrospora TaxID=5147 RepID=F7W6F4_SORMK|nr:uncharacterized protein SMAC_06311 [Sordaria macrospora k-hell]KAA8635203.1 hypothetical protein SMACR_06311 [Sordaria macrospora]KAH7630416.1 hypothetical protein B0T09DRAFT_341780 [Sordaria sp. MPI-SDFR-AT-0083]WPJ67083.1 hypothetical protein SMAC4_06311 [Sordaria macrospora]CCC13093.1 unnamed protein product [Sordaria macrospora k-hell]
MAAADTMLHHASPSPPSRSASSSVSSNQNKRRHLGDGDVPGNLSSKKQRTTGTSNIQNQATPLQSNHNQQQSTTPGVTPAFQPYASLLAKLRPRYEVKTMSVMPSTSIAKHVDKALQHLDRFNLWDQSVLPGVVLLSAKPVASSKLVTIAELVRRRIGEGEQKWFQYNVLTETEEVEEGSGGMEVVEDAVMDLTKDGDDDEEEAFETMGDRNNNNNEGQRRQQQQTVFERAIEPTKVRHNKYVSVFLSRIPIEELRTMRNIAVQSNEQHIEHLKKKRVSLVA